MTRVRPIFGMLPAFVWMTVIFLLSSRSHTPEAPLLSQQIAAVAAHFVTYGVLATLLLFGLVRAGIRFSPSSCAFAIAIAVTYGVVDEVHQSFVPGRDAAFFDVVIDALGATASVGVIWLLARRIEVRVIE